MEEVTRLDIQREGYNQAQPLASARNAAEQRRKEYNEHCKRMEADPEYRMKWERREKDFQSEKKDRDFYY